MEGYETGSLLRNLSRSKIGMAGLIMTVLVTLMAVFAPVLAPYGQEQIIPGVAANIVSGGDPALAGWQMRSTQTLRLPTEQSITPQ